MKYMIIKFFSSDLLSDEVKKSDSDFFSSNN